MFYWSQDRGPSSQITNEWDCWVQPWFFLNKFCSLNDPNVCASNSHRCDSPVFCLQWPDCSQLFTAPFSGSLYADAEKRKCRQCTVFHNVFKCCTFKENLTNWQPLKLDFSVEKVRTFPIILNSTAGFVAQLIFFFLSVAETITLLSPLMGFQRLLLIYKTNDWMTLTLKYTKSVLIWTCASMTFSLTAADLLTLPTEGNHNYNLQPFSSTSAPDWSH